MDRTAVAERLGNTSGRWLVDGLARPASERVWLRWHVVTLGFAGLVLAAVNRHQWFFGDEFAFFGDGRSLRHPLRALFLPHNEHWSTLPVLVYRGLFALVGLRSYWPYIAGVLLLHLLLAHLLWRCLLRAGAGHPASLGLAAVFAVLGAGSENILWAFQIGFVGSVLLGYAHALLVDHDGPADRRDAIGQACAVGSLLCSGIGVPMAFFAGATVWFRRRSLRAAFHTVAGPTVLFLAWYLVVSRTSDGNSASVTSGTLLLLPTYALTGLTNALERLTSVPGTGGVLLLALLVYAVRRPRWDLSAIAGAGAVTSVAFLLFVATGRSEFGLAQAKSGRYVYIVIALLLPLIGRALADAVRLPNALPVVIAALLVGNGVQLVSDAHREAGREATIRNDIVAAADIVRTGAPTLGTRVEPVFDPDVTVSVLRDLIRRGALPRDEVEESARLTEQERLQLSVSTGRHADFAGATLRDVTGAVRSRRGGCTTLVANGEVHAVVDIAAVDGALGLAVQADTSARLSLADPALKQVGTEQTYPLSPGTQYTVRVVGPATLLVTLPTVGSVRLCGVAQA